MGKGIREAARAQELEPVSLSGLIHQQVRIAIETANGASRSHPTARHAVRRREGMDVEDRPALSPANAGGE